MSATWTETVTMSYCKCERCGHKWIRRRITIPKRCPKCKSAKWNDEVKK